MDNGASSYRRFLEGDRSAFDEILILYKDHLIFFLNGFVHNLTVAEDLAADAFAYLLLHPKRYDFSVSLKTYLFMIGRSRALDWLRHEKHLSPTELTAFPGADKDGPLPEEQLLQEEEKKALYKALGKLNDDYRTALYLIYFEELSYEEAGTVMKKRKKQVENLVYRAKSALRRELGKDGGT